MNLEELDDRQIALIASRARCVIGLSLMIAPGIGSRLFVGQSDPAVRMVSRFAGIRDFTLGIGALTNLKEGGQDAEWLSMGAASDAFDGLVMMLSPGAKPHTRVLGAGAFGTGAALLTLSRRLAKARKSASVDPAH